MPLSISEAILRRYRYPIVDEDVMLARGLIVHVLVGGQEPLFIRPSIIMICFIPTFPIQSMRQWQYDYKGTSSPPEVLSCLHLCNSCIIVSALALKSCDYQHMSCLFTCINI